MSQTKAQIINAVHGSIVDADIVGLTSSKLSGALPAVSAANLTNIPAANLTGTLPAISGANLTGISAGITEADVWRLTQNVNGTSSLSTLTSWERADDTSATYIGSGMSMDSNGIFTFPSTGKWLINTEIVLYGDYAFGWGYMMTVFKGSGSGSYDGMARAYGNVSASSGYSGGFGQCLVDVTESGGSGAAAYFDQKTVSTAGRFIGGSTSQNYTSIAFIRLGDT